MKHNLLRTPIPVVALDLVQDFNVSGAGAFLRPPLLLHQVPDPAAQLVRGRLHLCTIFCDVVFQGLHGENWLEVRVCSMLSKVTPWQWVQQGIIMAGQEAKLPRPLWVRCELAPVRGGPRSPFFALLPPFP